MSLKSFHIVFIAAAILCSLGFAAWAYGEYASTGDQLNLGWTAIGALSAAGLSIYATKIIKRLRHVGAHS